MSFYRSNKRELEFFQNRNIAKLWNYDYNYSIRVDVYQSTIVFEIQKINDNIKQ